MTKEIEPADVYMQVKEQQKQIEVMHKQLAHNSSALALVCVLVCIQLFAKFAIFSRVIQLLRRCIANAARTDALLTLVEQQGVTTDKKASSLEDSARKLVRTAPALEAATAEVVAKVDEVPKKVLEAIKKDMRSGDTTHGEVL